MSSELPRTRSEELRERNRRVLLWSLGVASVLHVAAFVLWPEYTVEPLTAPDAKLETLGDTGGIALYVEVTFGPPEIFERDGTISVDSPRRQLEAARVLRLPQECARLTDPEALPYRGSVRLGLGTEGRAEAGGIVASTGDACADQVIRTVADALWYRWLPNERFPAPVDLIQPVTLVEAQY